MRKGAQRCPVRAGTQAQAIYGDEVNERHRHRYEVNNVYVSRLEEAGMVISARTPTENLPEIMELPDHRWFMGVQRSEEHTSELQSLMRISYAVFCLKKKQVKADTQSATGRTK